MKFFFIAILLTTCIIILAFKSLSGTHTTKCVAHTLSYIKTNASLFAVSTAKLDDAISKIKKSDPQTISNAKETLKQCRLAYKRIEFFLTYFLSSASLVYNQPDKVEVEEPFMEYHEPTGLQVIEAILFSDDAANKKNDLLQQADLINSSASDIYALLYHLKMDDKQVLESLRLELVRVITLGITGFDAPKLKTGISETSQALRSIKIIAAPFLIDKNKEADSVTYYLNIALNLLDRSRSFDSFNRLDFLTNAALPLQYHLGLLIKSKSLEINTTGVFNYNAKNLFSADAITIDPELKMDKAIISLGQKLFLDNGLSGNNNRSCATCHQPENYFTDQLPKSLTLNGKATVERNAPSLFYSTYQYSQFWDGRAKSLNEQIMMVMENAVEMGADHEIVVNRLRNTKQYIEAFKTDFPGDKDTGINMHNISLSLEAFLQTLAPFSSPFDKYMNGDKTALTQKQMNGFNLFMGKAQCGTCHYAPIFNGLIPPLYKRTELEVLGTTKNINFNKPELDADSGRFNTFPIVYYKGAFKTPTVRNVAKTAPYMHNGAFPTLESVLEFYNMGGGVGVGLNVPSQTLSPQPLKLKKNEIEDIIQFLYSLTDTYTSYSRKN
jgi:cytochrome c peroxidase